MIIPGLIITGAVTTVIGISHLVHHLFVKDQFAALNAKLDALQPKTTRH